MAVMFPNGSMERVQGLYQGNSFSDYTNRLTTRLITAFADGFPADRELSILEIGSGTGGTSRFVLEALQPHADRITYYYTDLSKRFLTHGEQSFGHLIPGLRFQLLDIEKTPSEQGFRPGSFDLIFGTNVLHATSRLERTLTHAKSLLRRDGMLIINEVTRVQDLATITFGLTGGWWNFEDPALRLPDSPLLSPDRWCALLHAVGFHQIRLLGPPDQEPGNYESCVVVGRSDGLIPCSPPVLTTSMEAAVIAEPAGPAPAASGTSEVVVGETSFAVDYIKQVFAEVLKINIRRIDIHENYERYGIDSLIVMELNKRFERDFGRLPATLLFENITVAALAAWFEIHHRERLAILSGGSEVRPTSTVVSRDMAPTSASSGNDEPPSPAPAVGAIGPETVSSVSVDPVASDSGEPFAVTYIKQVFTEILKIDTRRIELDENYERYGIDSLIVMELNKRFEQDFGRLPATLLFENTSVAALADWFERHHRERLVAMAGITPELPTATARPVPEPARTATATVMPGEVGKVEDMVARLSDDQVKDLLASFLN